MKRFFVCLAYLVSFPLLSESLPAPTNVRASAGCHTTGCRDRTCFRQSEVLVSWDYSGDPSSLLEFRIYRQESGTDKNPVFLGKAKRPEPYFFNVLPAKVGRFRFGVVAVNKHKSRSNIAFSPFTDVPRCPPIPRR